MTPSYQTTFPIFPILLPLLISQVFLTSGTHTTAPQTTEAPRNTLGNTAPPSSITDKQHNSSSDTARDNDTDLDYYTDGAVNETGGWEGNTTTAATAATTTAAATTAATAGDDEEEGKLLLGDFCLCDLKVDACDVNCCCDVDCSSTDRMVFSHCLPRPSPTPDQRYCVQRTLIFRTFTEFEVERRQDSLTCIVTDNLPQRTSHTPVQGARSLKEFRKLGGGQSKPSFSWPQQQQPWQEEQEEEEQQEQGFSEDKLGTLAYTAGDPVLGYDSDRVLGPIGLPTSVITSECEATQPILFLQDAHTSCTRVLQPHNLLQECQENAALSARSYLSFTVLADPGSANENATSTEGPQTTPLPPTTITTTTDIHSDASTIPTQTSYTTQVQQTEPPPQTSPGSPQSGSTDFTRQTVVHVTSFLCRMDSNGDKMCTETNTADIPSPAYTNEGCANVTREVKYVFIHNGTLGVVAVRAVVQLGTAVAQGLPLVQRFAVRFVWADTRAEEVFERSGRPGYILGKPLLLGRLVENVTEEGEVRSAITLDSDPAQWLTILTPGVGGHCTAHSQVTFGINMRSGCTIQLTRDDLSDCEALKGHILALLLGPQLSDPATLRVGTYGDSSVENAADWVPVLVPEDPRSGASTVSGRSGSPYQCLNLVLTLHLEVAYSLQGALNNPQAKVVGVVLRPGPPQSLTMPCHSCTQSHTFPLELASSVTFVQVTQPPVPTYAQAPALDVKLPYDFFYPFLPSCGGMCCGGAWVRVLWAVGLWWLS